MTGERDMGRGGQTTAEARALRGRVTVQPPERIEVWFCPACGENVSAKGGAYTIDALRQTCTAKKHRALPISYPYRRDRDAA